MEIDRAIDLSNPVIAKAIELARELSQHCKEHNLPEMFVINGVAPNAEAIMKDAREKGYLEGKLCVR